MIKGKIRQPGQGEKSRYSGIIAPAHLFHVIRSRYENRGNSVLPLVSCRIGLNTQQLLQANRKTRFFKSLANRRSFDRFPIIYKAAGQSPAQRFKAALHKHHSFTGLCDYYIHSRRGAPAGLNFSAALHALPVPLHALPLLRMAASTQ
jgi:hypothetical protein